MFILLRFSFFLNLFFFLLCSFSSSDTASGGSWWCPSWGGEGSPVRYRPGNLVGLISSELGVRATPPGCSALLCSAGLLLGGRKHSVISALPCYWLLAARCPGIGCSLWWSITSPCHLKRGKNRQVISDSLTLNTISRWCFLMTLFKMNLKWKNCAKKLHFVCWNTFWAHEPFSLFCKQQFSYIRWTDNLQIHDQDISKNPFCKLCDSICVTKCSNLQA